MTPETERAIQNKCTIREAREILGANNVFGPSDWLKFYGDYITPSEVQRAEATQIPWSQAELENPGINQEHFLFLSLAQLHWSSLNLDGWMRNSIYPKGVNQEFHWAKYLKLDFARKFSVRRWYLMPIGTVQGSHGLPYEKQVAVLPNTYEVPTTLELVTANILYYLLNMKYLDKETLSTRDQGTLGIKPRRIVVFGHDDKLMVDDENVGFGIAASRKLPPGVSPSYT